MGKEPHRTTTGYWTACGHSTSTRFPARSLLCWSLKTPTSPSVPTTTVTMSPWIATLRKPCPLRLFFPLEIQHCVNLTLTWDQRLKALDQVAFLPSPVLSTQTMPGWPRAPGTPTWQWQTLGSQWTIAPWAELMKMEKCLSTLTSTRTRSLLTGNPSWWGSTLSMVMAERKLSCFKTYSVREFGYSPKATWLPINCFESNWGGDWHHSVS